MKTNFLAVFVLALGFIACNGSAEPDPVMKQAFAVHNQAMAVYDSLHTLLLKESEGASDVYKAKLDSIDDAMHEWEENLVEVPGFEHEHHDHGHGEHEGHDHDHDHDASAEQYKDLPPAEMLAAQQAFLEEITRIGSQIEVAKAAAMTAVDTTATEE